MNNPGPTYTTNIPNYPFYYDGNPTTNAAFYLDKLSDSPTYQYKLYMSIHCYRGYLWALGGPYDNPCYYSLKLIFYNSNNVEVGNTTVINRLIYKAANDIADYYNAGYFYNWNIAPPSTISDAAALGLAYMDYWSAKATADANGLHYFTNYIAAGEPFGIRYASDTGAKVYYPKTPIDYTYHPANPASQAPWSTNQGYGRSDTDQGVQFTFTPPSDALYFRGELTWYTPDSAFSYVFPAISDIVPAINILDNSSKINCKTSGTWKNQGRIWYKTPSGWVKRYIYKKEPSGWVKK